MPTDVNEFGDSPVSTDAIGSTNEFGDSPVSDVKPNQFGDLPVTETTNAGADAAEEKQLADNISSYQEERKQKAAKPSMWDRFIETGGVLGETPEVGSGPTEVKVPRPTAAEVASATGISIDHAANLAGFMNSVSSPLVEFPFTPQGAAVAGASAIPGVAPVVGAGFTIKSFIDNPEMAKEAGAGWVEAHNPQSTPEQKQLGWEKFWGAIGNIGIGGMGAMPGAHVAAKKMGAIPTPTTELINAAKPVLPNAAKEAEAIPPEKGQPNAQAIRSDTGPAQEPGVQPESSKTDSGGDLQQAPPGTPDATAQAKVTPAIQTPEGKVITGEDHVAAYETAKATGTPDTSGSQEGFVDQATGEFLTREQAAAKTGLETNTEEGKLHSSDLPDTTKPISAGKEGETKTAQAELREADDYTGKAAMESEKATIAWAKHAEDVVKPLKANLRKIESGISEMQIDAKRTLPETKGKNKLTKKAFFEKYGVTSKDEANALWKSKNMEWEVAKRQLDEAEAKLKELEQAKVRRGKEWSRAATRAGELRRQVYPKVREGDVGSAKPISEGPGAASPGDVPSVQLDQLAQTFKSMPTTRTWADALKGSYDLGKLKSAAMDTVSRAVSGLKATGDLAKRLWENIGDLDEFKKILGKYSREVKVKDYSLHQFDGEVARTMPKIEDQEAIASWVDAGGDMATLKRGALETTDRYRKSYEDAQKLTPEQLVVAKNIQNYFEARLKEAMDAGILDSGIEDYIHRIYDKGPLKDRVLNAIQSGVLDTRDPSLARKRLFEFDFEAEKAGLPIIKAFLPRILDYEASLAHAIASRAAVKRFTELKEADGNPMIAVAGLGRVVEDQAGVKPPSVIVNPHVLNEKQRGLYEHRDYPALQKWKWVAKDTDGKNVFVQGDVLIHKDSVGRIDKFLKPSAIRQNPVGRAALAASSAVKQTMLDLSGFHQVQLTVHALEHRVLPNKIIDKIDLNNPDVQKLLEGGVTLGGKYRGGIADEGLWGKSLTRMIPGLGKLSESYHEYLFNDYIPRLKMTMAMDALERNRAKYGKKLSEEKLAYLTANEANAAFGELNYTMMERSKTWQDVARLILFAPDFLEARGKFVGQALTKYGSEQRMALLLGATTMYVTARIINKMLDGQYHFEKENLFSVVYKNHAYSLRTVQGDVLHLIDKPVSFWMNRLNPVYGRTVLELASGRDQFGRKRDAVDQLKDAVNTAIPISLRRNREQSALDSILISLGVTARKYSDVGNAYKLANDWRKKAGVKERPEVIYDPDKDDLYGLKVDLWNDDQAGAVKEIKRLIDTGKSTPKKMADHFKAYATSPFTGSRANDQKFMKTLNEDEKATVLSAITHKRIVWKQFHNALGIYLQSKASGPPKETP